MKWVMPPWKSCFFKYPRQVAWSGTSGNCNFKKITTKLRKEWQYRFIFAIVWRTGPTLCTVLKINWCQDSEYKLQHHSTHSSQPIPNSPPSTSLAKTRGSWKAQAALAYLPDKMPLLWSSIIQICNSSPGFPPCCQLTRCKTQTVPISCLHAIQEHLIQRLSSQQARLLRIPPAYRGHYKDFQFKS